MLRKNIRQRREYLYTLEREQQEKDKMNKKMKIIEAENNNTRVAT